MNVRARRVGEALVIALEPWLTSELGLDEGAELDVAVEDGAVVLRPLPQPRGATPAPGGWDDEVDEVERLGDEVDAAAWDDEATASEVDAMDGALREHFRRLVEGAA